MQTNPPPEFQIQDVGYTPEALIETGQARFGTAGASPPSKTASPTTQPPPASEAGSRQPRLSGSPAQHHPAGKADSNIKREFVQMTAHKRRIQMPNASAALHLKFQTRALHARERSRTRLQRSGSAIQTDADSRGAGDGRGTRMLMRVRHLAQRPFEHHEGCVRGSQPCRSRLNRCSPRGGSRIGGAPATTNPNRLRSHLK